jgi:ribosomal protein S4
MDGFAMFLGLAPNRLMAQELVHFGGIRVNGMVVTDKNYSINQNDMVQIDLKVNQEIQTLYKPTH